MDRALSTAHHESVAPGRWFAVAVPATIGYVAVGAVAAASTDRLWLGLLIGLALAVTTAAIARDRSADRLGAYVAGSAVTLLGLYASLAVAGELWLHAVSG